MAIDIYGSEKYRNNQVIKNLDSVKAATTNLTKVVEPVNWIDFSKVLVGQQVYGSDGKIYPNATMSTIEPVPVKAGDTLTLYGSQLTPMVVTTWAVWDGNKNKLDGGTGGSTWTITDPNAKWFLCSLRTEYLTGAQTLVKGTTLPGAGESYFEPYATAKVQSRSDNADQYNHLPRIDFTGDITGMSKDDKKTLQFEYTGAANYAYVSLESRRRFTGYAKVKWQGSSSVIYPKKNYSISLYSDEACTTANNITFQTAWGAQNKYVLKANFVDVSQSRNIVACRLWGQMVKSRETTSLSYTKLKDFVNGGAVDGYPTRVYFNGEYKGLYTLNLPKDGYTYGMVGAATEVLIGAEASSDGTKFKVLAKLDETDFAYEYNPEDTSWVLASFNAIYAAIQLPATTAGEITAKKAALEACIDVYSVIDYIIFIMLIAAQDNQDKNFLMGTFDGTKWFMSAYDCDGTFGNSWSGVSYYPRNHMQYAYTVSELYKAVRALYLTELKARYTVVRNTIINPGNLQYMFSNFMVNIPLKLIEREAEMYPNIAGTATNNVAQILNYMTDRCTLIDTTIDNLT